MFHVTIFRVPDTSWQATCGGGQTERSRHIVLSSAYGGTLCTQPDGLRTRLGLVDVPDCEALQWRAGRD